MVYTSGPDKGCRVVEVKAHEVHSITSFELFKSNYTVSVLFLLLWTRMWKSYLLLDTFSIGPVVESQHV